VTITYICADLEGLLTLTDDQALQVRRGSGLARPACAADVGPGDFVLVPSGEAKVLGIEAYLENTAMVEVIFEEEDPVAYVSNKHSPLPVSIFGKRAILVKILEVKRYDNFRELFFESVELAPCRDALSAAGLSMDLSQFDLGQGKLVVRDVELARQAMVAIRLRMNQGHMLRKNDVVVSTDMEPIVRDLVMNNPATMRKNQHVKNEPGELLHFAHPDRDRQQKRLESHKVGEQVCSRTEGFADGGFGSESGRRNAGFDAAGSFGNDAFGSEAFGNEGGFGFGSPPQVRAALAATVEVLEEGAQRRDERGKLWRVTGGEWRPVIEQSWVRH
jgi:hypothetical protein